MAYKFNPLTGQFDDSPGLVSSTTAGLLPAPPEGEPTGKVFTDALEWATPAAGTPGGSSGQLQFNNGGAFGGVSSSSIDGSGNLTFSARWIQSVNGAASAPPLSLTGTWFTGGTATTTKPALLIEPTGTTSTNWSTSGTGLGVNAPSGFTGNLLDLQINGVSSLKVFGTSNTTNLAYGASNLQLSSTLNIDLLSSTIRMHGSNVATGVYYTISGIAPARDTSFAIQHVDSSNGGPLNGANLTIAGQNRTSNTSTLANGGNVFIIGGNSPSGNPNTFSGGSVYLDGGLGNAGGAIGNIIIGATRGNLQITDARDVILGTTTGAKLGTATTQKLGFWGATPVVQPAAVADATDTTDIITQLNTLLSRLRTIGLIAT